MKMQTVLSDDSALAFGKIPAHWQLSIALIAGMLMGLTPAPANAWFFAWFALAPLWVLVIQRASLPVPKTAKRSNVFSFLNFECWMGLVWGIGYHGLALLWIRDLHPLMWLGVPWFSSIAIVLFAWVFVTLWGAVLVAVWAGLLGRLCRWKRGGEPFRGKDSQTAAFAPSLGLRLLCGVALWCGLEFLWSYGPLYWSSLSFTQSPHNLFILHWGQLSGPTVVTGAIVAFNGLLAEAWIQWQLRKANGKALNLLKFSVGLFAGLHLIGFALYSQPLIETPDSALNIGIIQGNIPTRTKQFEQGMRLAMQHYTQGYELLVSQGVEAVLTPEGAFPWRWIDTVQQSQHPFYQTVVRQQVPAWIGTVGTRTVRTGQDGITQSLFTLLGTGEIFSRYDKIKLVPLGEYIPLQSSLGAWINRLSPVQATMIPGAVDQRVNTPFGQTIAGICFDSAFPWLFRNQAATGGTFILTASNNDPYGAAMMTQHHAQDVMRAIETDRWVARATNTGFSSVIDAHGKTQWISGFRTYETHAHTIYRRTTQTLYVQWGDWLTPVLIGLAGWGIWKQR